MQRMNFCWLLTAESIRWPMISLADHLPGTGLWAACCSLILRSIGIAFSSVSMRWRAVASIFVTIYTGNGFGKGRGNNSYRYFSCIYRLLHIFNRNNVSAFLPSYTFTENM